MSRAAAASAVNLVDVADAAGIRFRHTSGASGRFYLAETVGSGCAIFDYDGDGRLDLFLVNSMRLPGAPGPGPSYPALYRNLGNGRFEDVSRRAGLAVECYGIGCAVGDYDNDGDPDLYLTTLGPNHLFRNAGDGTFRDVTGTAGVGDPRFSTSAAWFDYDRDGDLDLFVCNYLDWTPAANRICFDSGGHRHACGPASYPGASNVLYRNDGGGRFRDVTRGAGLAAPRGKGLGVLVWDRNDDGWLDLLVANDQEPNLLYENRRDGTFAEVGVEAGIAYSLTGKSRAGMGIDADDPLNDGRESVVIGNLNREGLALFYDAGQGLFTDVAGQAGLFEASLPYVTFATLFCDFDLDGWKDLLIANGHWDANAAAVGEGATFPQRLLLFHNESAGSPAPRFRKIGETAGPGLEPRRVYRGIAVGDIDGDGDPDALISANGGKPLLLRNEAIATTDDQDSRRGSARAAASDSGGTRPTTDGTLSTSHSRHWLQIRLRGRRSNRAGLGARLRVTAGGVTQTHWIRSGSSYASSSDPCAYVGLGAATEVEQIEVRWPSGQTERFGPSPADRKLLLREGTGTARG